jgi:hypothetical protein
MENRFYSLKSASYKSPLYSSGKGVSVGYVQVERKGRRYHDIFP